MITVFVLSNTSIYPKRTQRKTFPTALIGPCGMRWVSEQRTSNALLKYSISSRGTCDITAFKMHNFLKMYYTPRLHIGRRKRSSPNPPKEPSIRGGGGGGGDGEKGVAVMGSSVPLMFKMLEQENWISANASHPFSILNCNAFMKKGFNYFSVCWTLRRIDCVGMLRFIRYTKSFIGT